MQTEQYRFHRFIRNKSTGHFLRHDGSWTADLAQAHEFDDALTMLDYCHLHGLVGGIQVFLKPYGHGMPEVIADLF